jgi:hypothetical protein
MLLLRRWKRMVMSAGGAWLAVTVSCQPTNIDLDLGPNGWYSGSVTVEGTQSNGDCCGDEDEYVFRFNFAGHYDHDDDDD